MPVPNVDSPWFNEQVRAKPKKGVGGAAGIKLSGSGGNGHGGYDRKGTPKDKRGGKGARNGADSTGCHGMTFADNFKRS